MKANELILKTDEKLQETSNEIGKNGKSGKSGKKTQNQFMENSSLHFAQQNQINKETKFHLSLSIQFLENNVFTIFLLSFFCLRVSCKVQLDDQLDENCR